MQGSHERESYSLVQGNNERVKVARSVSTKKLSSPPPLNKKSSKSAAFFPPFASVKTPRSSGSGNFFGDEPKTTPGTPVSSYSPRRHHFEELSTEEWLELEVPDHITEDFRERYPEFTASEEKTEKLRADDFPLLDSEVRTYLDFTGAALPPQSLLNSHLKALRGSILGNPHSRSLASMLATEKDNAARDAVLKYFNANPKDYTVIWTANASAALKLVGESYAFGPGTTFLRSPDCHNSVNGLLNFAVQKGADVRMLPFEENTFTWGMKELKPELVRPAAPRTESENKSGRLGSLFRSKKHAPNSTVEEDVPKGLFAFPGQSNFTGIKNPLSVISAAQAHGWDVMLDAAALAPTSRIDLSQHSPEFVALSFYKMFGYPTGIGALIAKKDALSRLQKPWYGGGTVEFVLPHGVPAMVDSNSSSMWEDGTISFQSTLAVQLGLEYLKSVGRDDLTTRVKCLTSWLRTELESLTWSNGQKLVNIAGTDDASRQGSSIAFVLVTPNRVLIQHTLVEHMARKRQIDLRSGCFCNPNTSATALMPYMNDRLKNLLSTTIARSSFTEKMPESTITRISSAFKDFGSLRVSVGLPTLLRDVWRFVEFIKIDILACEDSIERMCAEWCASCQQ